MGRFSTSVILAQSGVTLAGIFLVLLGHIEYAGDYLTERDLRDLGLRPTSFRTYRTYPWGRMILQVSAEIEGPSYFLVTARVEAGATPSEYREQKEREKRRHAKNRRFPGYHELLPLGGGADGYVVRQRIPSGPREGLFTALTEANAFHRGHLLTVAATRTEVPEADLEDTLRMTEARARAVLEIVKGRCR